MLRASANVTDSAATPLIASRLSQAIGQSGLFYEAHQAQWVSGERTIESTAAEPQRHRSLTERNPLSGGRRVG